jgi:hypothetical protein
MNTSAGEDISAFRHSHFRILFEDVARSSIENSRIVAAKSLEAQLVSLYRLAAATAKAEESVDKVAQIWELMVGISDAFAKEISSLHTSASLDKVLDIRSQCEELRNLHRVAA